jgi:hypothetical protein
VEAGQPSKPVQEQRIERDDPEALNIIGLTILPNVERQLVFV